MLKNFKTYDVRGKDIVLSKDLLQILKDREQSSYEEYEAVVQEIIDDVKENGDNALLHYNKKFDQVALTAETLKVTAEEIKEAYKSISPEVVRALQKAYDRISHYHQKQKKMSWFDTDAFGTMLGQKIMPIHKVGIYVPGGKAVYPSSVLMNIIPAIVAGVQEIIMVTPAGKDEKVHPATLVAADICGVANIIKAGGAQAIAALAYGTKTVPKVDKIVGPGNIYVALAKKKVFGHVGIDSIAGPSEILVITDETAELSYVAADMLSQAEHDELASAICITTDIYIYENLKVELERQIATLERKEIMSASLNTYGAVLLVDSIEKACEISDRFAPEHLELCVSEPVAVMNRIQHAGAIFLGNYSPEPLGDYMAGPNHVLPTNQTARFFSPLSVDDFIKKSSIIYFNEPALADVKDDIITLATEEKLTAHANAIRIRYASDFIDEE